MKIYIVAIFCIFTLVLAGQSQGEFSLGLQAKATYVDRQGLVGFGELTDSFFEREKGKISADFGIVVGIELWPSMEFRSGLIYSNLGYRIPKSYFEFDSNVLCVTPDGQVVHCGGWDKHSFSFIFLELPFEVRQFFGQNGFFAQAGLGIGYHLKSYLVYEGETSWLEPFSNRRDIKLDKGLNPRFYYEALIGAGKEFDVKLIGNFSVGFQFRFLPQTLVTYENEAGRNFYSIGLVVEKDFHF